MKKTISFLLMIITLAATFTSAAKVTIGSDGTANFYNAKFYTMSTSNVPTRTSIYSGNNGYIAPNDLCTIKDTSHYKYWKVEYPTSSGPKLAYVDKSEILSNTSYCKKLSLSKNETVYKRADMRSSFGTVFTSDNVYILSPISNGKAQIIYNISGGYKIGWIYATTNDNISNGTLTQSLYKNNNLSSKISCGFDGYVSTPGRHEGIDFAYGLGKSIYSLTDGEVIRVSEGIAGSTKKGGKISTIAVYDKVNNKTVIYVHADPTISKGTIVTKGTKLGYESYRGCTNTHTHVEVRNGRREYAAKSVGDKKLDNDNPTPYWNSQGYVVK